MTDDQGDDSLRVSGVLDTEPSKEAGIEHDGRVCSSLMADSFTSLASAADSSFKEEVAHACSLPQGKAEEKIVSLIQRVEVCLPSTSLVITLEIQEQGAAKLEAAQAETSMALQQAEQVNCFNWKYTNQGSNL